MNWVQVFWVFSDATFTFNKSDEKQGTQQKTNRKPARVLPRTLQENTKKHTQHASKSNINGTNTTWNAFGALLMIKVVTVTLLSFDTIVISSTQIFYTLVARRGGTVADFSKNQSLSFQSSTHKNTLPHLFSVAQMCIVLRDVCFDGTSV